MQHLNAALDALVEAAVEAVIAGFDGSTDAHLVMRAKGAELRQRAAAAELLGPALSALAHKLIGEVERRSVPRYAAILRSVRYNNDAAINELEDARKTLNASLLAAQRSPDSLHRSFVMLAILRVRAITTAIGPDCVAQPAETGRRGAPLPRRRAIQPGDISSDVAAIVTDMAATRVPWAAGLARLTALEAEDANAVGLVTSILALAAEPTGHAYIKALAARIERAGLHRQVPDASAEAEQESASPPQASVPPPPPSTSRVAGPAPTPPTSGTGRAQMMERFGAHLARGSDPRELLIARHRETRQPKDPS